MAQAQQADSHEYAVAPRPPPLPSAWLNSSAALAAARSPTPAGATRESTGFSSLFVSNVGLVGRLRPYSVKRTVSRPICEVKPLQATSVLRWGTTWESVVPQAPLFAPTVRAMMILVGTGRGLQIRGARER